MDMLIIYYIHTQEYTLFNVHYKFNLNNLKYVLK